MADNAVRIGVTITGSEKAARDLAALKAALEATIPGMNGGAASISTPSNAPPGAPKLYNPTTQASPTQVGYGGTLPGVGFGGGMYGGGGYTPSGGVLNPAMAFHTGGGPLPPGALAQYPTGAGGGFNTPPPYGGSGGGGNNGGGQFGGGQIVNVHIASSSVPLGGGGGGNGGGGGQGGSGGSGGGQVGSGGGAPLPNGMPGSSFLETFLGHLKGNATMWGAGEALLRSIPAGPAAIYGGVMATASYGLNAYDSFTRPSFQANLDIAARQVGGSYVNPIEAAGMRRTADLRGSDQGLRALMSPFDKLTFGAAGALYDLTFGRDFQSKEAMSSAQAQDDLIRQQITAVTGQPLPTNASVTGLQAQIDQARLRLRGDAGGRGGGNPAAYRRDSDLIDSLTKQIAQAKSGVGDTQYDSNSLKLVTAASVFGPGLGLSDAQSFIKKNTDGTFNADMVTQEGVTAYNFALKGGNADLAQSIIKAGGTLPDGLITKEVQRAIGSGDLSTILGLKKLIGDADKFKSAMGAAIGQFELATTTIPVAAAHVGITQANMSFDQASGMGYQGIAKDYTATGGAIRTQLTAERQYLVKLKNPADRAQQMLKIRGLEAQLQGTEQQSSMTVFSGRGVDTQTSQVTAGNAMYGAMYGGGGQAGVDKAYGQQSSAMLMEAKRLEDMSNSPFIPPEQRALYAQQARQARQQATVGVARDRSQFDYSITQGKIGVGGATADANLTHAQMFGGPGDIYTASLSQSRVIGAQRAAVESRLDDPSAHLSQQERLDLIRQEIELRKQESQVIEQSKRSFLDMNVAVADTRRGISAMSAGNAMSFEGAGGGWARSMLGDVAGKSGDTLTQAQKKLDAAEADVRAGRLSRNSDRYQDALGGVTAALGKHLGDTLSLGTVPLSAAQRGRQLDIDNDMNIASKTYTSFGNMRGLVSADMDMGGQGLTNAQSGYQSVLKQIDADWRKGGVYKTQQEYEGAKDQAALAFKQQRNQYDSQIVGDMGQLQSGFLDRVISSTYNAPSRMNFVASSFTQAEASRFLGGSSPVFGSRSAADRDGWMMQGPRLMNKWAAGDTMTPAGMVQTAMAGGGVPMGGVLHPGGGVASAPIQITVRVVDGAGKQIGAVNTTSTIHALQNGGLVLGAGSAHSAGVSRQ